MDEWIKTLIEENLDPVHFELINNSHKHAGHAGDDGSGQTHFKLIVVSEMFQGHTRVECQRMVTDVLKEPLNNGLHAIEMRLSTP